MSGRPEPVIVFLGQPNCGKSTLFNAIAGPKAQTSNFPGTTVQHTHSQVLVRGRVLSIIDLPGTYSLSPSDPAERTALTHLFGEPPDLVVNVVDASILGRSLELTLELLEMGLPMIVALNMSDLAARKGITVDPEALSRRLGCPVITTIALQGKGIGELIDAAVACLDAPCRGVAPRWSADVEAVIEGVVRRLPAEFPCLGNSRFTAIRMLESGGLFCSEFLTELEPGLAADLKAARASLEKTRGRPAYEVISGERHHLAQKIFEESARVRRVKRPLSDRLDDVLLHRWLGYPVLAAVLLAFFLIIFKIGSPLEALLLKPFLGLRGLLESRLDSRLLFHLAEGLLQGIGGGIAIVLPYYIPLLALMALLEDVGYLARAGFLLDAFMHRIGLHGKSVAPFILGFGCNVPAIVSTRILESRRDRVLTSLLIPFIPCSARTTIILALVAFFLGPWWALGFYAANILLIAALGRLLSLFNKDESPGLLLEIPSLKAPSLKNVGLKVFLQLKAFVRFAWPLLILGSLALGLVQSLHWDRAINAALAPLVVGLLGLPSALGVTLIFGFLRKELSLLMMMQALGVGYAGLAGAISHQQIAVFTVFVSLFIPCLSTFVILWKEIGRRVALLSAGLSVSTAIVISLLVRLIV
ncbi:MAG: ferrous iron transport protein B [Acidobacteriota bacterium]|nr:ferrous iron transport protein B [Acidobacteriota bacterium]